MSKTEGFGSAAWQIDFGAGRQIDVEIEPSGKFWSTLGPSVDGIDLWLKQAVGDVDLRLRVERLDNGLVVRFDRRESDGPWWQGDSVPKILFRIEDRGILRVVASVGGKDVELGTMRLRHR